MTAAIDAALERCRFIGPQKRMIGAIRAGHSTTDAIARASSLSTTDTGAFIEGLLSRGILEHARDGRQIVGVRLTDAEGWK